MWSIRVLLLLQVHSWILGPLILGLSRWTAHTLAQDVDELRRKWDHDVRNMVVRVDDR